MKTRRKIRLTKGCDAIEFFYLCYYHKYTINRENTVLQILRFFSAPRDRRFGFFRLVVKASSYTEIKDLQIKCFIDISLM